MDIRQLKKNLLITAVTMLIILCLSYPAGSPFVKKVHASENTYVTPQFYGAAADGRKDDTAAFQRAVDSGYPVYIPKGVYYITRPIEVNGKRGLWVQGSPGAVIHRAFDKNKRVFLFHLKNCEYCMFKDLNIISEIKGEGTVPNGHTRPSIASSNILAFGGEANRKIYFFDNTFTNMESDYWFNDSTEGWSNIVIRGWKSRNSSTALYAQKCTDLTIYSADVVLNPDTSGDGDHCIYIADGSSDIKIRKSVFDAGECTHKEGSPNSVLTFHRTENAEKDAFVSNVTVSDCTVRGNRFFYGNGGSNETIYINNCQLEETFSRGSDYTGAFGGNASYRVISSNIKVKSLTLTGNQKPETNFYFYGCSIDSEESEAVCFANPTNLWVQKCDITVGDKLVYVKEKNDSANVTFEDCNIYSSGTSYLISKRNRNGTVRLTGCTIQNMDFAERLIYNGNKTDMTGFALTELTINGYKAIASSANIKNAELSSIWLNGKLVN